MNENNCKYFRHEPYMTPNNYDIYIQQSQIPSNIPRENSSDMFERLQKLMPLGKVIHINFDNNPHDFKESSSFKINTLFKINGKQVRFV